MQKRKTIIASLAVASLLGSGIYGVNQASAEESSFQPLYQKISERFNLNKDEVKSYMDEHRQERRQKDQGRFEERLNQAVVNGDITEDQKNLITAKKESMQQEAETNRIAHQNLSQEDRDKFRQQRKDDVQKWAQENGIDMKYFFGGMRDGSAKGQQR